MLQGDSAGYSFCFIARGNGYYEIRNQRMDKGLDVAGISKSDGAIVTQWCFVDQANQMWCLVSTDIAYVPGDLTVEHRLSTELTVKVITRVGQNVPLESDQESNTVFHRRLDAGATFVDRRDGISGGWVYMSNSDAQPNSNEAEGSVR